MEKDSGGIRLLKKSKRGLVRAIFSRTGLIFTLLMLQFFVLFLGVVWFDDLVSYFWAGHYVLSVIAFLALVNSQIDPSAKLTWIVVILLFPLFGTLLFWYTKSDLGHRTLKKLYEKQLDLTRNIIVQKEDVTKKLPSDAPELVSLGKYLEKSGCHPVFAQTKTTYFPSGESQWDAILCEIKKAEKFIFLEYFIVEEGVMWGKILEILAQKAADGVDVRFIYDGTCEFTTLPHSYPKQLKKLGIATKMFAPVAPFASTHYNYRDHRKILVIDGKVGFTGGSNLADEYINARKKYGHWKDAAIMLEGDAVSSLTLLFLQMWNLSESNPQYEPYLSVRQDTPVVQDGYVIPFGDFPLDAYRTCEMIYIDILNRAERYVHIMTPYLILDGALETALKFAAQRGVEVTLILPGTPDKKVAYALARTHYAALMKNGVKIYEYTPGFVHAKVFVSDDIRGVVGTVNLDYRSLYHHFECAAYLYRTSCLRDIEKDFRETLTQCEEVTLQNYRKKKRGYYLLGLLLKILAPLL
ncbi:MAG: cardiolipin synthase [Clostridia bacterium]|nr:cardiolipin synthase [Clostridia bacterium]